MYEMEGPRLPRYMTADRSAALRCEADHRFQQTRSECRSPDSLRVAEVASGVVPVTGD